MLYPYAAPIILTDALFQKFGGILGDTLPEMRQVAYQLAEQFVSEDLETYLLPTPVTGTYSYHSRLTLDHTHVNAVHLLRFYDTQERLYWTVSGTANIYASLWEEGDYGLVDLHQVFAHCGECMLGGILPYRIQVAYTAGLPSGTSYQPHVLMALKTVATVILNEMIGFGNEAPGDIGVQRYSSQNYSETRVGLIRTVYGTSPQAQFAHKLLTPLRLYRYVGL